MAVELVRPGPEHLPAYIAALQRGWSANTLRSAEAAREALAEIATDPAAFLAVMHDPEGAGPPVPMPDGSTRPRLPGLVRWIWDGDLAEGFCGSIGLRWMPGGAPLPPYVLGHIGYSVVPWQRGRGRATQALAALLPLARAQGLTRVELTTDPDNLASQRVIVANGGVLLGHFTKDAVHGGTPGLRYAITLA